MNLFEQFSVADTPLALWRHARLDLLFFCTLESVVTFDAAAEYDNDSSQSSQLAFFVKGR